MEPEKEHDMTGHPFEARLANRRIACVALLDDLRALDRAVGMNSRKIWLSVLLSILKSEKTESTLICAQTWGPPDVFLSPAQMM